MNDQAIRAQALNPQQSFIVQAPAGSGKTELLIQRFLRLLTTAKIPEEIIAITFTRKAATEMRDRIISAINEIDTQLQPPDDPHKKLTWILAKSVIKRNQQQGWKIEMNPNRLRVLTIDALAKQICSQMPILSRFGASPSSKKPEEIKELYRKAVDRFLESKEHIKAIEKLLLHLDNKAELLEKLLIRILIRREQWLPYVNNDDPTPFLSIKKELEKVLITLTLDAIQKAQSSADPSIIDELVTLAQFAGHHLYKIKPTAVASACRKLTALPGVNIENADLWKGIAELFLTKKGLWRKKFNKNDGFPSKKKEYKKRVQNLCARLTNYEKFQIALNEIKHCPPLFYTENQWNIIHSIISILPILTTQLAVIFQEHNVVDFTGITLGAILALGNDKRTSDYGLQLDKQIHHLLIDEFQDTSIIQFRFIEKLINGWKLNDGRTIFLVGDPMQSIYRFRQAEVGLFLQVKNKGISEIQLTTLTLRNNFRSQENLITWFNQTFKCIFPKEENSHTGSIPYSHSLATKNSTNSKNVNFYSLINANPIQEASQIIKIVQSCRQENPAAIVAILVRYRSQLIAIIPAMRAAGIPFHAMEIEKLAHRIEIQDLISLTHALHHLGDRIAWLSLLRAPWCGLTLHDLHAVSFYASNNKPLWITLQSAAEITSLTCDGKNRIHRIFSTLSTGFENRDRLPLAQWIEGIWTDLGGPACLTSAIQLQNAKTYFQLLEKLENEFTLENLTQKLDQLYAQIDNDSPHAIQIMTIHKAKGLEFDHVILPSLEKKPRYDDHDLLLWLECYTKAGNNELILAPLKYTPEKIDLVYNYLKRIEKEKTDYEITRLLYVAATRTKESLHLVINLNKEDSTSTFKLPHKGSFAYILWPACHKNFEKSVVVFDDASSFQKKQSKSLHRLISEWRLPFTFKTLPTSNESKSITLFTSAHIKIVETVIHETLKTIANEDLENWSEKHIKKNRDFWQRRLTQLGIPIDQLNNHLNQVITAITNTLSDMRGRWILSHKNNQDTEYPITTVIKGEIKKFIIDHTFIDEKGMRWIIDYKFTKPNEQSPDLFLKEQYTIYETQLYQYATALCKMEIRPTKLGLYFPLCQGWYEWNL